MARDAAPPFPLRRDAAVVAAADSGAAGAAGGGDVPTGPTPPAPQVRDIDKGRFPEGANIIIVTHGAPARPPWASPSSHALDPSRALPSLTHTTNPHPTPPPRPAGLTLRIFLARWFHWSVQEYEQVYNPPNSQPLVLLRRSMDEELEEVCYIDGTACDREQKFHVKDLYYLTKESMELLEGTNAEMCEMLIPEKAFERTLTPEELDDSCTWLDEGARAPGWLWLSGPPRAPSRVVFAQRRCSRAGGGFLVGDDELSLAAAFPRRRGEAVVIDDDRQIFIGAFSNQSCWRGSTFFSPRSETTVLQ